MLYAILCVGIVSANEVLATDSNSNQVKAKREYFKYDIKLGWFTLGEGKVSISKHDTIIDKHYMDKVHVHTQTSGFGNWLSNLDDDYVTYLDSKDLKSRTTYKDVRSGNDSHWEQWNNFRYSDGEIDVRAMDHRKENPHRQWTVAMKNDTYDLLGTFIHFKEKVDWSTKKASDTVMVHTLYKHDLYRVGLQYLATEKIKYNGEMINSHKLRLLMPDQEKLEDDRPVYVWITTDKNQYPIRIYSKLFIGSIKCELETINGKSPKL